MKLFKLYFNYGFVKNKSSLIVTLDSLLTDFNIQAYLDNDELRKVIDLKLNHKYDIYGPNDESKSTLTRIQ